MSTHRRRRICSVSRSGQRCCKNPFCDVFGIHCTNIPRPKTSLRRPSSKIQKNFHFSTDAAIIVNAVIEVRSVIPGTARGYLRSLSFSLSLSLSTDPPELPQLIILIFPSEGKRKEGWIKRRAVRRTATIPLF